MRFKSKLILSSLLLILLLFVTGCTTSYSKVMPISSDQESMMAPPFMMCCNQQGLAWNETTPHNDSCCSMTASPDTCTQCLANYRYDEVKYPRNHRQSISFVQIVIITSLILVILAVLSVLVSIANKITSIAKETEDGFLSKKLKKIITIYQLVVLGIVIIWFFFYIFARGFL
jgi:hypothetical protein